MTTDLNILHSDLLLKLNIEKFNPMQEAAIEAGTKGLPLILLSPTGSGKTIAFLMVILNRLNLSTDGVTALVIVPSRELALQIEAVFRALKSTFKITCCYGGHSFKTEQQRLQEAPALIIGTPGRIQDHLSRGSVDLSRVDIVVIDEFDKSLEMGFQAEIEEIFGVFNGKPQVILTSATRIENLPDFVRSDEYRTIDWRGEEKSKLKLHLVKTASDSKPETLMQLVSQFNQEPALIFCNHREAVERISLILKKQKFEHAVFHGALEQIEREKSLIKFRSGSHNVLVATDLASRGLDIPLIKHVVHFQCPVDKSEFLHRNGRTARMHAEGAAYLILGEDEELPSYLNNQIDEFVLDPSLRSYPRPAFSCLYVSAGKKDKISKGDILGFFTQVGGLSGDDIGLISVLDNASYIAINRIKADTFLSNIKDPKIKKMKVRIQIAN